MTPLKNLIHILNKVFIFALLLNFSFSFSQENKIKKEVNEFKSSIAEKVKTKFKTPTIELERSGLVSNVLYIVNSSTDNLNFTLDVLIPNEWNSIVDSEKIYSLPVNDTIIVPILLIPSKVKSGSSQIVINTFLIDLDGQQIGDNSFQMKTKKTVKWDLGVKTANKFYFKNDEFNKKFEYSIINKGNYKQDISVNHKIPKKDLYLSDTSNVEDRIANKHNNITLEVGEEADFSYYASAIQLNERNKRKVSNTNYTPYENKYYKNYDLVINSTEDKSQSDIHYKKTAKVSFVKLPNEIDYDIYGYPTLPLLVDAYIQNILGANTFMSVNLRGTKQLSQDASLVYNTTLNFNQSTYNRELQQDIPWYIGYYDDKKSIEIGQVYSNIIGITSVGNGVKGSYRLNDKNILSAFYIQSNNNIQNARNDSYGFTHNFHSTFLSLRSQIGRNDNKINQTTTDVISLHPRLRLFKTNIFDFSIARSLVTNYITDTKREGFVYGAGFSTKIARKLRFNVHGRYNDANFGTGGIKRINLNHRTSFKFSRKWNILINNNYQSTENLRRTYSFINTGQQILNNRLSISKKVKAGSVQNGVFYDIRQFNDVQLHNRGLSYRFSTYNNQTSFQSSYLLRAGYTQETQPIKSDNHFSFDFTSLLRYRIWNFTFKYNYGNFSVVDNQNTIGPPVTPQLLRFSIQNQYTFKNRRFILETNSSYTYRNIAKNNSFGINPELFYFSKTNWRYSLQCSYIFNSTDYSDIVVFEDEQFSSNRSGKNQNSNLTIGLSIRKEIGIPIPFAKKSTTNVKFIAFKDLNGNNRKDYDESPINNVVINLDKKEVITSYNGVAKINNTPYGKFKIKVLPLEKSEGWFSNVPDSIPIDRSENYFIPFVKGVKLHGDVIMDRQKIAITDEGPMDLSRIKITATKEGQNYSTLTDLSGHFEFYLPNGEYVLTMDDSILSSTLRLSRNNIPVVLNNNQDGYYTSFYILEKRRKVIIRDFSKKKK